MTYRIELDAEQSVAPAPIRVMIVDDHQLFRRGLQLVLGHESDIEVIGEAGDAAQALAYALEHRPDVILMDVRMPGGTGIEACAAIKIALPSTHVVIVTMSDTDADLLDALRAGASAYVFKEASIGHVATTVRSVVAGRAAVSGAMALRLLGEFALTTSAGGPGSPISLDAGAGEHPVEALTDVEETVLARFAAGRSAEETADELLATADGVAETVRAVLDKVARNARALGLTPGARQHVVVGARVTPAIRSATATHSVGPASAAPAAAVADAGSQT